MNYDIAVVKGDGIGPEVVTEAIKVLDKIGEKYGHTFHYNYVLAGGAAIDATGKCLPTDMSIWRLHQAPMRTRQRWTALS